MIETRRLKTRRYFYPNNFKFCAIKKNYNFEYLFSTIARSYVKTATNFSDQSSKFFDQ